MSNSGMQDAGVVAMGVVVVVMVVDVVVVVVVVDVVVEVVLTSTTKGKL